MFMKRNISCREEKYFFHEKNLSTRENKSEQTVRGKRQ